ncbi:MAG: MBL fold metallo-hydrolase [Rhodocyclaceae bacterium]|nr:MBL fold metallo-hydrolase [Rhodocyclaceae bacterium]
MRPVLLRTIHLLAAAATLFGASARAAETALEAVQVSPSVWYVQGDSGPASAANQGFNSNAGFVVTRDSVVVFDTLGTPELGEALIASVRKQSRLPVKRVVISHYHADHYYGLSAFKALGAEIWADRSARGATQTDAAQARLAERRRSLAPWVDETTRLVDPDHFIDGEARFTQGGLHFRLTHIGPAHAPDDLVMLVEDEGVLFAGDLLFAGRVPFVGDANTAAWLKAIDRVLAMQPKVLVVGHGTASREPARDLQLTRRYLTYLRNTMGEAVANMTDFETAYRSTDWSEFSALPAFEAANRRNAYNVYLEMERESLQH